MAKKLQLYRNDNILKSREAAVNAITAELSTRKYDGEFIAMRYYQTVTIMPIDEVIEGEDNVVESGATSSVTSGNTTNKVIKTIFGCGAYDAVADKYHVTVIDLEEIENTMNQMGVSFTETLAALHQTINDEIKVALDKEIEDRQEGDDEIKQIIVDNERVVAEALSAIANSVGLGDNFEYVKQHDNIHISGATSHATAEKLLSNAITKMGEDFSERMEGLASDARTYTLSAVHSSDPNVRAAYQLVDQDNNVSGATIEIYKDSALKEVILVEEDENGNKGQFLKFTYITAEGTDNVVYLNVSAFLVEAEFKNGLQVSDGGEVSVKIDAKSEAFLTVSENGVKLSGVAEAIEAGDAALRAAVQDDITPRLDELAQQIKGSTLSAITVNEQVGMVDDKNMATVTIDGSHMKLSSDYTSVTYPKSGTASAFTAVEANATVDEAIKHVDGNVAMLVEEVILNEKTIAEALSVLRKSAGFDVNGEYVASNLGGYLADTTNVLQALATLASKVAELEAKVEALESQL